MDESESCSDSQLPLRFILPSERSLSSCSQRLLLSEESEVLRGIAKLQGLELRRKRVQACFHVWARDATPRDCDSSDKDSIHYRYRRHRPRMISQHSDFPTDVLTEASTPGVFDFAHRENDRLPRAKTVLDAESQTDVQLSFSPEIAVLRSQYFPEVDSGSGFWPSVLAAEIAEKADWLQRYESSLIRLCGTAQLAKSQELSELLSRARQWTMQQEEELRTRREQLEEACKSVRTQSTLATLERKVEELSFPRVQDLRLQYAHLLLDRQSLELERRLLELRQEELIAHREILCIPRRTSVPDRSTATLAVLRKWALHSLRTQPISLQLVPVALVLLQVQCRMCPTPVRRKQRAAALRKALRTVGIRERLVLKECLRLYYFRSVERRLLDFHRSGYSPSFSYTSIGDECAVRSPQGLFVLKSMELIADSNRHAALGRLESIANRWKEKDIPRKATCWTKWRLQSLRIEVRYYRALLQSVDSMLQSIRKSDQQLVVDTRRCQVRVSQKLAEVSALCGSLLKQ